MKRGFMPGLVFGGEQEANAYEDGRRVHGRCVMRTWIVWSMAVAMSGSAVAENPARSKEDATVTINTAAPSQGAPAVIVTGMEDSRKAGRDGAPGGLKVTLSLAGIDAESLRNVSCSLTAATDETGQSLIKAQEALLPSDDMRSGKDGGRAEVTAFLKNPSRKAAFINIEGTVNMYVPADDPQATIRIPNIRKAAGLPVQNEALEAVRASVVLSLPAQGGDSGVAAELAGAGPDDEDVAPTVEQGMRRTLSKLSRMGSGTGTTTIEIVDPAEKIQGVEFFSSTGKRLRPVGSGSMGKPGEKLTRMLDFDPPLPDTAEMRIYLLTPKSQRKIPFSLKNVPLP